ncbi:MAG: DUF3795 domain-containing protein [Bacteroidales bacterium]|jgi:hypothetical protein
MTMIACCGLLCDSCPIHLATLEPDEIRRKTMRVEIAQQCREHYGMDLAPEDVGDCDGCLSGNGRLFSGCRNCEVRACARQKAIENCAFCDEYACNKLKDIFNYDPEAEARLNKIRTELN